MCQYTEKAWPSATNGKILSVQPYSQTYTTDAPDQPLGQKDEVRAILRRVKATPARDMVEIERVAGDWTAIRDTIDQKLKEGARR